MPLAAHGQGKVARARSRKAGWAAPASSLLSTMPGPRTRPPTCRRCASTRRGSPRRLHVPGHKGGPGADPELLEAIGERALALDIPALTYGIDLGPEPTPFEQAQRLAAAGVGCAAGVVPGQRRLAGQPRRRARARPPRRARSSCSATRIRARSTRSCSRGMRPTFAAPETDPELGIAHCLDPGDARAGARRRPRARSARGWSRRPTSAPSRT